MSPRRHEERAPKSRAEHKADRREEFIDAAVRAVSRLGTTTSIEDIAQEIGVTRPIVYRYFGDRQGLGAALAERYAAQLLGELQVALSEDLEPRELVARTIDAYLAFVERDVNVYRYLFRDGGGIGPEHRSFVQQLAGSIAVTIGERLRAIGADSGVAEPWAYALIGMVHQAGDWWVERRTVTRARLVDYLVRMAWDGMGAAQPASEPG